MHHRGFCMTVGLVLYGKNNTHLYFQNMIFISITPFQLPHILLELKLYVEMAIYNVIPKDPTKV